MILVELDEIGCCCGETILTLSIEWREIVRIVKERRITYWLFYLL
jgi:hypothetical protein